MKEHTGAETPRVWHQFATRNTALFNGMAVCLRLNYSPSGMDYFHHRHRHHRHKRTHMASITDDQIATIQVKLATLVADKATADAATVTANAAVTAAQQAAATAAQANLDEAAADAKASGDLQDLVNFVESLAPAPAPIPDTAPAVS